MNHLFAQPLAMIMKRKTMKLIYLAGFLFFIFCNINAQVNYNTVITLTADNDSVQNVILKTDTISVYYIHAEEDVQIHATAIKKNNNTFLLNIKKGVVIALIAGYQNCYGGVGCFDVTEEAEANQVEIPVEARDNIISGIKFFPPCVRDE